MASNIYQAAYTNLTRITLHQSCKGYCSWAECGTSRGSKGFRLLCNTNLKHEHTYGVTDIINKTELGKYVSVCVRYRVTWHASVALVEGGSGTMAGQEREVEAEAEGEVGGVPLTNPAYYTHLKHRS